MHQIEFPKLSKIAKDVLAVTATSVPSEEIFSSSGDLISKKRNRLGHDVIESIMCLKSWNQFLDVNKIWICKVLLFCNYNKFFENKFMCVILTKPFIFVIVILILRNYKNILR